MHVGALRVLKCLVTVVTRCVHIVSSVLLMRACNQLVCCVLGASPSPGSPVRIHGIRCDVGDVCKLVTVIGVWRGAVETIVALSEITPPIVFQQPVGIPACHAVIRRAVADPSPPQVLPGMRLRRFSRVAVSVEKALQS